MVNNVSYVQGSTQALVIIHWPHVSTASLSQGWGFRRAHRPTCSAAMYSASLGVAWVERDIDTLHISILGL